MERTIHQIKADPNGPTNAERVLMAQSLAVLTPLLKRYLEAEAKANLGS